MYTEEQMAGILLTTATPRLKIVKADTRSGWTVRHDITIRAPKRMTDGIERGLGSLFNIEPKRIPEPKRHRDMLVISRQADIIAIANIIPLSPAKSNAWGRFKRGINVVEEKDHIEMKREDFEAILNDETEDIYWKGRNG